MRRRPSLDPARSFAGFFPVQALLGLWLFTTALAGYGDLAVPKLKDRVIDQTGVLSGQERSDLERALKLQEAATDAQVAVLLVPSTLPETLEQYGIRVVEAWKLGDKGRDDGVLILVAIGDRRLRIEVGYGLEGVLPDATARRIVDETITPHFKRRRYFDGLKAGIAEIARVIGRERRPLQD